MKSSKHIYTPIIKDKGFNPSPVAGKIPFEANSLSNPQCVGTRLWEEFWLEQFYLCTHGYKTGGIFIPPRYYHFLNFYIIDGVKHGTMYPDFTDLQFEIFTEEFEIRNSIRKAGLNIPKARRKGISFFGTELICYGARFIEEYRAGVAAGLETWIMKFRSKLQRSFNRTVPEMKMNILKFDDKIMEIGYEEKLSSGQYERTVVATVLFETFKDKATKFEGEFFHDTILEEVGEFEKAPEALISIFPAQKDGEEIIGKIFSGGTGGNMLKGGASFSRIYHEAESYFIKNFFIPGRRYYTPYVLRFDQKTNQYEGEIPNLLKQYPNLSPEQLLGCEDVVAAQEALDREKEIKAKNPDKKRYIEHCQNYPDEVEDVFRSGGSNKFNTELLYMQIYNIDSESPKFFPYILDFVINDKGEYILPFQVKARPAKDNDKEWEIVWIKEHPSEVPGLDVVGIDSYDVDDTMTSKSLGGICVLRDYENIYDFGTKEQSTGIIPIAYYYSRPPKKELFWEMGFKISIYWRTYKRDTMIGADHDAIIGYYKQMPGGAKYLSKRPKSFDSPEGKQIHEYGFKASGFSKPMMLSLGQSFIENNAINIWTKYICNDFIAYDEENIGNDYDLADACMHALIRIRDRRKKIKINTEEEEEGDKFSIHAYIEDVGKENNDEIMDLLFPDPATVKKN